jgi:signal transduction histidine kinase
MRLSVGTRWTLRYSAATLVLICILAVMVYDRVERRILQDAKLLLDLQVQEVMVSLERYGSDDVAFASWLERKVDAGGRLVDLGVALFDPDGHRIAAVGALEGSPIPVSRPVGWDPDDFVEAALGRSYPHYVATVQVGGRLLQVAIYGRPFERRASHILKVFQIAVPAVVFLTLLVGWWLSRSSLRPIAEITRSAQRITGSHLEELIPTSGTGDELDRLSETLNEMMARVRVGMERSREFQSRLARELRSPLLALQREIAGISNDEGLSNAGRDRMQRALEDAEALAEAVHALLRLSWSEGGRSTGASVQVPLASLVRAATTNVAPAAERRGVMLSMGPLVEVSVSGDPFWLHQLFDSMAEAAVAAAPNAGAVAVFAEKLSEEGVCLITVRAAERPDGGTDRESKSEPSAITAAARLALAREIARAHGGQLETLAPSETETEYRLRLPIS